MGFSKDPQKRLKQLQTANGSKLELLYVVEGNLDTEAYYHRMFSQWRLDTNNEWFEYDKIYTWIKRDKLTRMIMEEEGII